MTTPKRRGMVVKLRADQVAAYCALHADTWPDVQQALRAANIRNYTIYLRCPENILFGHWEYHGNDFAADLAALDARPVMKKWLAICGPMQVGLGMEDDGWAVMEEVFHLD
ncbi:L-rhamnose mutarotase [Yoonia tamlensis]|uniref:L-rhamnose mutarotase n=1 Tax=Yoonia tamlensis TaxID=390270 RepID=A0A1I6FYM4_9RHOB|nr:L-rhamnose mutarotase [Yoonia tamlensis]SFR35014.1 L-rhamnose mutarotase [Yoonia tamlensis]